MLAKLRALWAWASEIGMYESMPIAERQKVRLLNQMIMAVLPIQIVLIGQDLILRDGPSVLITILPLVITLITLWFQAKRWFLLARMYVIIFLAINMILLAYLYGPSLKAEYTFLVMAAGVMLLFEEQRIIQVSMFIGLFICFELTAWIYMQGEHPLMGTLNSSSFHLIFLASLVAC
ncbi:MAG: hypothetical protein AAFP02_02760, partial [Bacteroidota bacterium]